MSEVALVVQFQIKPGRRDDFVAHVKAHAARSLVESDGCLQFDVLVPKEVKYDAPEHEPDTTRVLLYERYRDEDAFQAHIGSDRVADTRAGYADMIESRWITRCEVQGT